MIREDSSIRGIPIPGPDGELAPAPAATRLAPQEHTLKERGLVDDTMIALASSASIPPLLRVLDPLLTYLLTTPERTWPTRAEGCQSC